MHNTHFKLKWFLRGLVFAVAFLGVFSLILMLLWNWLMPGIFGLTRLDYLQSAGLLVLSKIIFSGFGRRGGHSIHDKKDYFRKKYEERCGKEKGNINSETNKTNEHGIKEKYH